MLRTGLLDSLLTLFAPVFHLLSSLRGHDFPVGVGVLQPPTGVRCLRIGFLCLEGQMIAILGPKTPNSKVVHQLLIDIFEISGSTLAESLALLSGCVCCSGSYPLLCWNHGFLIVTSCHQGTVQTKRKPKLRQRRRRENGEEQGKADENTPKRRSKELQLDPRWQKHATDILDSTLQSHQLQSTHRNLFLY